MDSDISVLGLKELQDQLDQLPALVERKLLRGALRAGQQVVADYAKSRAPVGEPSAESKRLYGSAAGDLRDSIRVSAKARGGTVTATVTAGPRKGEKKAFYAHWVEYGTAAHVIAATPGLALMFGGQLLASVDHPGAKMHPFMRPALDYNANGNSAAFQAVGDTLALGIVKEQFKQLEQLPDERDGPAP
jgi:HK97 gp10 family phage protein